ncbi:MAG: hypothetical protein M1819_005495 [Sarea resinae]|nr:MAG: hypothetical protein M1819_005495 [Sarea resinae]
MAEAYQIFPNVEGEPWLSGKGLANLELRTVEKPSLQPGRVLIRIKAVSLNARDAMVIADDHVYPVRTTSGLSPCSDGAGLVEEVNDGSSWQVGDRVVLQSNHSWTEGLDVRDFNVALALGGGDVQGTLRQYALVPEKILVRAPRNLSFEEAATLPTAGGTALNALFHGPSVVESGTSVVTQGTGGVSMFAIQLAAAVGAEVIATSSSDEKLDRARKEGAKHLINYRTTPDWAREVRAIKVNGVDHVVDVAGAGTIQQSLQSLRQGGLVSVIGILTPTQATDLVPALFYGAKTARGILGHAKLMLLELVELVEKHDIHPVIGETFEWEDAKEAFKALVGQSHIGKLFAIMPDDGLALGRPQDKARKNNWRGKLFSTEEAREAKKNFKLNDDVTDFLRPSTERSISSPAPRVDTFSAQRWPSATEITNRPTSRRKSDSPRRTKNKGLNVRFTRAEPEIIGRGGDETDVPPQEISLMRARSHSPTLQRSQLNQENWPRQEGVKEEQDDFRPPLMRRAPTGFVGLSEDSRGAETLPDTDFAEYDSPVSPLEATRPDFSQKANFQLAEEAQALHQARDPSPPDVFQDGGTRSHMPGHFPSSPLPTPLADFDPMLKYSSHSSPLPTPLARPSLPSLPSALVPGGVAQSLSSSPSSLPKVPRYADADRVANSPPKDISSSPSSLPIAPPLLTPGGFGHSSPGELANSTAPPSPTADDALEDFSDRVQHLSSLFHLAAESAKPIMETPFAEWIQASTWWFLKGRVELEVATRNRPRSSDGQAHPSQLQPPIKAWVNLAKAWWIVKYIAPQHPEPREYGNSSMSTLMELAKSAGDEGMARLLEMYQAILTNLRALAVSMRRNQLFPPQQGEIPLGQGQDTSIWIKYPFFTPDICTLLAGNASKSMVVGNSSTGLNLSEMMPLGDTSSYFSYGRMFVVVSLASEDDTAQFEMPCLLSILRERTQRQMMAAICSQNALVNICIQDNPKLGPTWKDVHWKTRRHLMVVKLPRGFTLSVQLVEKDFKNLWGIHDYMGRVEAQFQPEPGEILLHETKLRTFKCLASSDSRAFPSESLKGCHARLFERTCTRSEGTGERRLHRGFRLVVVTSPKLKTLSSLNPQFGKQSPIEFGYLRCEDGAPAMLLQVRDEKSKCRMVLSFHEAAERSTFHMLLNGNTINAQETLSAEVPLKKFFIDPDQHGLGSLEWQQVRVINNRDEEDDLENAQTVLSQNLRICADGKAGTVTDRLNLGPGELQLRLNVKSPTEIKLLKPPQEDLTMVIAENQVSKQLPDALDELLKTAANSSTVRTYDFHSLRDLHAFQAAITAFTVQFDGVASTFAISRRRMVVPIYKRWEANLARLQVLRQDKTVQLVAFFEDFNHGSCMNFNLKSTDVFEIFSKSGRSYLRIVDAKFALPKGAEVESRDFVCVDMPEYPGEHDDIVIGFDSDADRDRFQEALPAPVSKVSRMASLRK